MLKLKEKKSMRVLRLTAFALVVGIICFLIVSCRKSETLEPDIHNGTDPEGTIEDNESDTPEVNEPDSHFLPIRVTGGLHDSMALEYSAKTAKGYYEVIIWPPDMCPDSKKQIWCGNIVYTDYETCKRIYLCNVPGCAHNTPDCTSFVKYCAAIRLFTDYSEDHLYMMSTGMQDIDISLDQLPSITEMEMDGSNRRTVCTLDANESFSSFSVWAASDEYVYAIIEHTVLENGLLRQQKDLERIWFEDGKRELVLDLSDTDEISQNVLSTWGDKDLIINQGIYGDEASKGWYYCRLSQSGEEIERFGPRSTFSYYSDQYIITGEEKDKKATVIATDYATGQRKVIEGVPAETNFPGSVFIYVRYGDLLNWTFFDENGKNRDYILDFSDGTIKDMTLRQENTYEDRAIAIIADAGNSYFAVIGEKNGSITLTDEEGIPHVYPMRGYPMYALISKEDYWNCIPNYRYIDDNVC